MATDWSSFYKDSRQLTDDAFVFRLMISWPRPGGCPESQDLPRLLDLHQRSSDLDDDEWETYSTLVLYGPRVDHCKTINTIIVFVRNLMANGLELPSFKDVGASLKESTLHFWHLLHHKFGECEASDSVIRGQIYDTLSETSTSHPSRLFHSCEDLLRHSDILQTLLGDNPDLHSKKILEVSRSGNVTAAQEVPFHEDEAEDNVFFRKVEHYTDSLARTDIPPIVDGYKVKVGNRTAIPACPPLMFITLERRGRTTDDSSTPWWSFEQLASFSQQYTTFHADSNNSCVIERYTMLYTLCTVINMTNDQIRVYTPCVDPMSQMLDEAQSEDVGDWKIDRDAGPFLLVYRQADNDVQDEDLIGKEHQFVPPMRQIQGDNFYALTPMEPPSPLQGGGLTPLHERLKDLSPTPEWGSNGSESGEIQ